MRRLAIILSITLVSGPIWAQQAKTPPAQGQNMEQTQNSGTDVQLRGISAVSDKIAWASGASGTASRVEAFSVLLMFLPWLSCRTRSGIQDARARRLDCGSSPQ